MGVIVQRHGDVGVAHDVLQRLGVHTGVCHAGTERVPEGVRGDVGQLLLVLLVVLLHCQRRYEIVRKRRRNFVVFRRGGGNKTKRFLAQKECSRFAVSGA